VCQECEGSQHVCQDTNGRHRCTDLTSDPLHCGACGAACPAGNVCRRSQCVPAGLQPCYTQADCDSGMCRVDSRDGSGACCPGAPGEAYCGGSTCPDLYSDPANCGACGKVCAAGEVCSETSCCVKGSGSPCRAGQLCCSAGHACINGTCQIT
jgi:hypothetical protein